MRWSRSQDRCGFPAGKKKEMAFPGANWLHRCCNATHADPVNSVVNGPEILGAWVGTGPLASPVTESLTKEWAGGGGNRAQPAVQHGGRCRHSLGVR